MLEDGTDCVGSGRVLDQMEMEINEEVGQSVARWVAQWNEGRKTLR
jgi:hypothetical protein